MTNLLSLPRNQNHQREPISLHNFTTLMAPKFTNNSYHLILLSFIFMMIALSCQPVAAQSQPTSNSDTASQYGYFSSRNLTSSMLIIVILIVTFFFLAGFASVYIRQCAGEQMLGVGPGMQNATMNRQPRGLDPAVIAKFPIMGYSEVKEHKIGKQALECAVCLSEFEDDEKLRLLAKCSHVFHPDCIDAWLSGHVTCPVCRCNLTDCKSSDINISINPDTTTGDVDSMPETTIVTNQRAQDTLVALPADAVVVEVKPETEQDRIDREEVIELERIRSMRRGVKSKSSWRPPRFPRSHSTGHSLSSLSQTGEDPDIYTLRIPDHVLSQIIAEGKLRRCTSALALKETGEDSSKPGYRGTGEGSSRGSRSVRMFVRDLSERFSAWGIGWRGDGEGSVRGEGSTVRGRIESVEV